MHKKTSPLSWRNSKKDFGLIEDINARGIVESFTTVHMAPKGFEKNVPYILALIILGSGKKVTAQVVDCKSLSIGAKVEPCIRRISADGNDGIISYGVKFRLSK